MWTRPKILTRSRLFGTFGIIILRARPIYRLVTSLDIIPFDIMHHIIANQFNLYSYDTSSSKRARNFIRVHKLSFLRAYKAFIYLIDWKKKKEKTVTIISRGICAHF